jgi:uncharacterized protein (DUF736 family)
VPNPIYDPNMRGVLFRNDKTGNDKRPDYRGSCVINNVDMNVSGWIMTSKKSGDKFMSLKFEPKGEGKLSRTNEPTKTVAQPQLTEDNWDRFDDTPF